MSGGAQERKDGRGGAQAAAEAEARAVAWIADRADEIADFCMRMVACPSVLTDELEVQQQVVEPFIRAGRYDAVERASFDPDKERPNLSAVWRGGGGGRSLLFNGHCDVVPVTEQERVHRWRHDPFAPTMDERNIYGRGASDMKGGVTAFLWAVRALQETGVELAGDLLVSVVVGEESAQPQFGVLPTTRRQIEAFGAPDLMVVAEPTHTEVHCLSGGYFGFEIEIQGKEVHVCSRNLVLYPQAQGIPQGDEVGVDASRFLRELLDRFDQLERRWVMGWRHDLLGGGGYPAGGDHQGVGPFLINPGRIEAGTWSGTIPGHARIEGGVLYAGWLDGDAVKQEFRDEIEAYVSREPYLREHPPVVRIGEVYDVPPFSTPVDHPGSQALGDAHRRATGRAPVFSGFKGVHDGCYVQRDLGLTVLAMGPGDLSFGVHGANEYVPIDQLIDVTKTFAAMAIDWCGLAG